MDDYVQSLRQEQEAKMSRLQEPSDSLRDGSPAGEMLAPREVRAMVIANDQEI